MQIASSFSMDAEIGFQGLTQLYRKIDDVKKDLHVCDVETDRLYSSIRTEEIIFPFGSSISGEDNVDELEDKTYYPTYIKIQKSLIGSGYGSKLEIIFSEIDVDTRNLKEDTKDYSAATAYNKVYSEEFRNLCLQALWLPLEAFAWQIDHASNLLYVDQLKAPLYNPTIELANSILNKTYTRLNLLSSLAENKTSSYEVQKNFLSTTFS